MCAHYAIRSKKSSMAARSEQARFPRFGKLPAVPVQLSEGRANNRVEQVHLYHVCMAHVLVRIGGSTQEGHGRQVHAGCIRRIGPAEHVHSEDHETRLLKTIKVGEGQYVYLSARNNGHVLGQKFLLETRVSCDGESQDFTKLEVKDSYSVCNMKPESIIKNTKGTALAMLVKSANINKYYDDIGAGIASPDVSCNGGNEVLKFSLKNFCK